MMKRLPSFTVLLLMAAIGLIGMISIPMLNVQYTPQAPGRTITVSWSWAGSSAKIMEAEVTSRIEGVMSTVGHVGKITSGSDMGSGWVAMDFDKGTDMASARFEVASKIRNIHPFLPEGVSYPSISLDARGRKSSPVITYVIKSPLPSREIYKFVSDNLLQHISSIEGVENVRFWGDTPFEIEIVFDENITSSLGICADDIASAVRVSLGTNVIGLARTGEDICSLKLSMMNSGGLDEIPIMKVNGKIIRMSDIATWSYREAVPTSYHRLNGLNTMTLSIYANGQDNMLQVTSAIRRKMDFISESFPDEFSATLSYDASEYVSKELKKICLRTFLSILILLIFVLLVSRSLRYLWIIASTLSVNILVAIAMYNILRIPIHIYTLAGITVSLGIIIDTSIVMADHYSYYRDRSVFLALLGATSTTIGALCMVALLPENDRANLLDFSKVMMVNLAVSLLVAYFFIPALLDKFPLNSRGIRRSYPSMRRLVRLGEFYNKYISSGLRYRWAYILVMVAMTGGSLILFSKVVDKSNFYREPEEPVLTIRAGMPEGCNILQMNEVMRQMESYLSGFEEVSRFVTNINSASDASISVWFKDKYQRTSFPVSLKSQVTSMAVNFGGANWTVSGLDNNYFNNFVVSERKNNSIELSGYNYDRLVEFADTLICRLSANKRVSGAQIVQNSGKLASNEYNVDWDFNAMAARGASPYDYYSSLYSRLYDSKLGQAEYAGDYVPVVLRSSAADEFDLWHVNNVQTELDSLKMKLSEVGTVSKKRSGLSINRYDQSYILTVGYDFIGSYELHTSFCKDVVEYMNGQVLPIGFKAKMPEYGYWSNNSKWEHAWLILLVILVIYVMCSMIFESLRFPIAVIMMIPVSFVGVFMVFWAFEIPFDQGGFAALVMLSGIVVNSGIYLINAYCQDTSGRDRIHRYIKAYNHKIIPILLTIISTILGLIPFLFDGPSEVFWFAFAVGTIGGMVFSLFAFVAFLPIFCFRPIRKIR